VLHLFIALLVAPEARSALAQTEEPPPAPAQNASRKTERIDIDRFGSLFLDAQNNLQATDILARWREYTIQAQGVEGNPDTVSYTHLTLPTKA
jgi:hypothetical protein